MKYAVYSKFTGLERSYVRTSDVYSKASDCYREQCELVDNIIASYGSDIEEGRESVGDWHLVAFRNNDHIPFTYSADLRPLGIGEAMYKWNDIISLPQVVIINGDGL
jgi:NDP-sugar pyrophosphorylase family protein